MPRLQRLEALGLPVGDQPVGGDDATGAHPCFADAQLRCAVGANGIELRIGLQGELHFVSRVSLLDGTIAPVREIVMVISDLYLPEELGPERQGGMSDGLRAAQPGSLKGIERIARLARRTPEANWRGWVAEWLGLGAFADRAPASVAAAGAGGGASRGAPSACWLATPVHLIGGMTRVHMDWRCLLRLPPEDRDRLVQGFKDTFAGSGFALTGLDSGEFLLTGPPLAAVRTTEPARLPQSLEPECLPAGEGAVALRRLGGEIEMWLHAHPVNSERVQRGEAPVSTLWIWGGGEPAAVATRSAVGSTARRAEESIGVFGSDAYVAGLCRLGGLVPRALPAQWPPADGLTALCVVAIAEEANRDSCKSFFDVLASLDQRVIAPSVQALRQGAVDRLTLLADDRRWSLRPADRWRFWRRARAGVEALT